MRSYGLVETAEPGPTVTWVDRGADVLASRGRISQELAAALKAEARCRAEANTFFGFMAYASMMGGSPNSQDAAEHCVSTLTTACNPWPAAAADTGPQMDTRCAA